MIFTMSRPKGSKNGVRSLITKQCETCMLIFHVEPYRIKARFCSCACKNIGHSKFLCQSEERNCQNCNKPFLAQPADKKIYCSRNCSHQAHGKKVSGHRLTTIFVTNNCSICQKQFSGRAALQQKFCSRVCANKSYERRINLTCQICSNTYTVRAKYHNQKYCSRACRTIGIGKTESYLEKLFANALTLAGIIFQKQYPIGTYTVDFAVPQNRIVIECDGEYWHSQPLCIKRDRRKDKFLSKHNWQVLRFPEKLINTDLESCIEKVRQSINFQSTKKSM